MNLLSFDDVSRAAERIKNHTSKTPLVTSGILNEKLHCQIFFKLETHQKTGSFKARGAFNHLLYLKEKNQLPEKIVAVSSGNHAQAVAYACKMFGISALIYTSKVTSSLKIKATREYGAEVIVTDKRSEANQGALEKIKEGYHFIHPSDDDLIIAGQGTACLEAINEINEVDAIFTSCGGGGLASGSYLAVEKLKKMPQLFAVEPDLANDAALSLKNNKIYSFSDSPSTIADGARTLAISERTFVYLKKINGIITSSEEEIIYWTQQLHHLLKVTVEPTSAMAMAGCYSWIRNNNIRGQKILVIISGGNISAESYRQIWQHDFLSTGL